MEQNLEPQRPRIGTEEVRRAADILRRYHAGKRQLSSGSSTTSNSGSCGTGSRWKRPDRAAIPQIHSPPAGGW